MGGCRQSAEPMVAAYTLLRDHSASLLDGAALFVMDFDDRERSTLAMNPSCHCETFNTCTINHEVCA